MARLGASVAPVAPVFEALGLKWGKSFDDPMHFEVKTFIDHPRSITQDVVAHLDNGPIDLGARNLMGHLMVDVSKATTALGLVAGPATRSKVRFEGGSRSRTAKV